MKNPILEVKDTWGGSSYIEVLRLLDKDDFDIEEKDTIPEKYADENGKERPWVFCSYSISVRKEVLDHLIEVLGLEIGMDRHGKKPMFRRRNQLYPLALEWHPIPATISIESKEDMIYRGIRKDNVKKRQDRYSQIRQVVLNDWVEMKEEKLLAMINKLWVEFHKKVEEVNEEFDKRMRSAVEDLNVSDKWIKKHRGEGGRKLSKKVKKISEKIESLKRERKYLDLQLADYDRGMVVGHFTGEKSDFSDELKGRINEMGNKSAGKMPETRRRGFLTEGSL